VDWYTFVSYARVPGRGVLVDRFFRDLCQELGLPRHEGEATVDAFLDVRSILVGEEWNPALNKAVGTCRTMVTLYAPEYFRSPMCGLEWGAFHERQLRFRRSTQLNARALIPVIWDPVDRVPEVVDQVQYLDEAFGATYARLGLRRMLLQDPGGEYRDVVRLIAERVRVAADNLRIPHDEALDLSADSARGPFPVPGARAPVGAQGVHFFAAAPGQEEGDDVGWRPFTRMGDLVRHARELVEQSGFTSEYDAVRPDLSARLDEARERRQVAVVLVDTQAAAREPAYSALRTYDRENHPTTGAIVPLPDDETGDGDGTKSYWERVRTIFPRNVQRGIGEMFPTFRAGVGHLQFDRVLSSLVAHLQNKLFSAVDAADLPEPPSSLRSNLPAMPLIGAPPRGADPTSPVVASAENGQVPDDPVAFPDSTAPSPDPAWPQVPEPRTEIRQRERGQQP
jgi:FxsC-like protein